MVRAGTLKIYNRKGWNLLTGSDRYKLSLLHHDKVSVTYAVLVEQNYHIGAFLANLNDARSIGLKAFYKSYK